MGLISVAAFRPRPGKERALRRVLARRLPLLRRLGLATARTPVLMKSSDGVIIQVSEWTSASSIRTAHRHPEVLALWEEFSACSEYVRLDELPESHEEFATFRAVP